MRPKIIRYLENQVHALELYLKCTDEKLKHDGKISIVIRFVKVECDINVVKCFLKHTL